MSATMKRRLAKLEKRLQPARCAVPAVCWCFRDEAGELRRYDNGEPAHSSRVVRIFQGHYNEAGELVKDQQTTNHPDGPDTFDIIITAPRIDPATGRAIPDEVSP